MINIEKIVDAAVDLRVANLRAREQGIIHFTPKQDFMTIESIPETFQIYCEEDFKEILKTREYTIKKFKLAPYKYEYMTKVAGLNFICITMEFLFDGDENRIKEFRCEECGKYFIESDLTEENICRDCEEEMWQYGNK